MLSLLALRPLITGWSFALDSSSHYVFSVYAGDVVIGEHTLSYAKCQKLALLLSWQVQS
jgi:hypothetical protein